MPKKVYVRLFDFKVYNDTIGSDSSDDEETKHQRKIPKETIVRMYGMNKKGKTVCLNVIDYKPFFYVKIPDDWDHMEIRTFKSNLKIELNYLKDDLIKVKSVKKKKLYGFDKHKQHSFLVLQFNNTTAWTKARSLWYDNEPFGKRALWKDGYRKTILYEAKLPPLLRLFHIKDISPSGWISFNKMDAESDDGEETNCDYEYCISYNNIFPENKIEDAIPLKVCSFDIEASSSHGDFPLAKKTYLKMCREIVTYWRKNKTKLREKDIDDLNRIFKRLVLTAFDHDNMRDISELYFKKTDNLSKQRKKSNVLKEIDNIIETPICHYLSKFWNMQNISIDVNKLVRDIKKQEFMRKKKEQEEEDNPFQKKLKKSIWFRDKQVYSKNIIYLLATKEDPAMVAEMLEEIFKQICKQKKLPMITGDKVTFIGSTFMRINENTQYKNHMIVLNSCSECKDVPNTEIETYNNERDVLLAWTEMIQREDPDIIIGYNIFGFDYKFMIDRSRELRCEKEFLKLGRNIKEQNDMEYKKLRNTAITRTSIKIASGTHDLTYIKMEGRLQLDLYNYFRREVNLPSYKLDYVASHFIGDMISNIELVDGKTKVKSKNMMGLLNGHYISFEILGHSSDMYQNGKKFVVKELDKKNCTFMIDADIVNDLKGKKIRWCLAKDDVTPQDIFRLTNEGPDERAIIAKYCFQDCNLVHNLMKKNDIFTGISEIASICFVPIEFIIMRGQGIKLLSFIAKKASEKNTLMPVLDVVKGDLSYEGAICLYPHCGLYIDNPVAVVDYASLYPSSMISENISHDSKVWTKEYDLNGEIVIDEETKQEKITGVKDENGNFKYDNLPGYRYVDITYDRYVWRRKGAGKAQEKIKVGTKTCRFAQFPDNKKAIMPSVLHELLAERKATRKFIKYKTITMKTGEEYSGLYSVKDGTCKIIGEKETWTVNEEDVENVRDTYDDFMKNVFDKRQLGYKVTANSLYGQCGAKTSSFFEMDIAASTTATGRKLLIYGKNIIEGLYGNRVCETKYGKVRSKSKVVYGDTDSCFMSFNLEELDGTKIKGKKALDITIELAIECGEIASKFLKAPHDLEYEKTFDPFLLLSKKRYVGMLYETNINKCKRKSMGIVLKRRDNAPVVKDIYGGIIDIIMKEQDIEKAVIFTKNFLQDIVEEKIPLDKLIITKSLREFYKNPESIAHKVLADRIGKRDPGNKPSTGSRIPFVYIQTAKNVKLQGDKIEHPNFIKENKLKPDYGFYITNQIMKPVSQIYALVLEDLKDFKKKLKGFDRKRRSLERKWRDDEKKCREYIMKERNKHVKDLIFDNSLRNYNNIKNGQRTLMSMFG